CLVSVNAFLFMWGVPYMTSLGIGSAEVGTLLTINVVIMVALGPLIGVVTARFPRRRPLLAGLDRGQRADGDLGGDAAGPWADDRLAAAAADHGDGDRLGDLFGGIRPGAHRGAAASDRHRHRHGQHRRVLRLAGGGAAD